MLMVAFAVTHFPPTRLGTAYGSGFVPIEDGSTVAQTGFKGDDDMVLRMETGRCDLVNESLAPFVGAFRVRCLNIFWRLGRI